MKCKLVHPAWTHLPAIAVLVWMIVRLITSLPLPKEAAVHFSVSGIPDSFGKPWLAVGIILALSVLYIVISVFLDELWARQETRKTFNWLSLMDEAIVGFIAGTGGGYLLYLSAGSQVFAFPWVQIVTVTAIALIAGIILELLRPYRAWHEDVRIEDTSLLESELKKKLSSSMPVAFWQSQNPGYVTILSITLPIILFAGAIATLSVSVWVSVILFIVGLFLIVMYGGQRTLVTQNGITVRLGLFGIPLLSMKMSEIVKIEGHSFSPLKDFGGYGIRFTVK